MFCWQLERAEVGFDVCSEHPAILCAAFAGLRCINGTAWSGHWSHSITDFRADEDETLFPPPRGVSLGPSPVDRHSSKSAEATVVDNPSSSRAAGLTRPPRSPVPIVCDIQCPEPPGAVEARQPCLGHTRKMVMGFGSGPLTDPISSVETITSWDSGSVPT